MHPLAGLFFLLPGAAPDLCAPDPWDTVCTATSAEVSAEQTQRHVAVLKLLIDAHRPQGEAALRRLVDEVRPDVMLHVDRARAVFLSVIGTAQGFSDDERRLMQRNVRACSQRFTVWRTTQLNGASVQRTDADWLHADDEKTAECGLHLPPKYLLECRHGTANCYRMLFHEMAHFLNACRFLQVAADAHDATERRTLIKLAGRVAASSADLKKLGTVREGQENACVFADEVPPEMLRLCERTARTATDRPSQWEEVEADAWSAVALAAWTEATMPDEGMRRRAVLRSIEQYCVEQSFHPLFFPDELTSDADEGSEWLMHPIKTMEKEWLRCDERGASGAQKGAWPAHPPWPLRWNRFILRNGALRRALGCHSKVIYVPPATNASGA